MSEMSMRELGSDTAGHAFDPDSTPGQEFLDHRMTDPLNTEILPPGDEPALTVHTPHDQGSDEPEKEQS